MSQENKSQDSFDPLALSKELDGESLSWKKSQKPVEAPEEFQAATNPESKEEQPTMSDKKAAPGMAGVLKQDPLNKEDSVASKIDPAQVEALAKQLEARNRVKDHSFLSEEEIAARAERSKDRNLVPKIEIAKEAKKEKNVKKNKSDAMIPTIATGKDAFYRKKKAAKSIGSRVVPAILFTAGSLLITGNIALMGLLYYGHSEQIHSTVKAVVEGQGLESIKKAAEIQRTVVIQEPSEPYMFPPAYGFNYPEEEGSSAPKSELVEPSIEIRPASTQPKTEPTSHNTTDWMDTTKDAVGSAWDYMVEATQKTWAFMSEMGQSAYSSVIGLVISSPEVGKAEKAEVLTSASMEVATTKAQATNELGSTTPDEVAAVEAPPSAVDLSPEQITTAPPVNQDALSETPSNSNTTKAVEIAALDKTTAVEAKSCAIASNVEKKVFVGIEEKLSKRNVDASVLKQHEIATSYLVYLPKELGSSNESIENLKKKGVTDSHLIRIAGPLNGALSLGLFATENSAKKQQQILEQKGIRGTKVGPRSTISVVDVKLTGLSNQIEMAKSMLTVNSQRISFSNCKSTVASSDENLALSTH